MNAVAVAFFACVAVASCTVVAPVQQYYVPSAYSGVQYVQQPSAAYSSAYQYVQQPSTYQYVQQPSTYQYVQQPSTYQYVHSANGVYSGVSGVKSHTQYAVPSTQQYVSVVPSAYYTSPVGSTYGAAAYYPSASTYVIGKK